jgi:hypothetical protein
MRSHLLARASKALFTRALAVDLSNDFNLIKTDMILMELQKEAGKNSGKK